MNATQKKQAVSAAAIVDELGDIGARLAPYRSDIKREETLRKALRDAYSSAEPSAMVEVHGTRYTALLSPCSSQTVIDKAAAIKALGVRMFAQLATITIKALESALSPAVVASICSSQQTGPRSITIREN